MLPFDSLLSYGVRDHTAVSNSFAKFHMSRLYSLEMALALVRSLFRQERGSSPEPRPERGSVSCLATSKMLRVWIGGRWVQSWAKEHMRRLRHQGNPNDVGDRIESSTIPLSDGDC